MSTEHYIYIGLIVGISALGAVISMVLNKKGLKKELEARPEASLIYLKSGQQGAHTVQTIVQGIDGNDMRAFVHGTKSVIVVDAGERELDAKATATRPGVMYKTVEKTYSNKVAVTIEPKKKYQLSFNNKAKDFEFKELGDL